MQSTAAMYPRSRGIGATSEAKRPKRYACDFPGCSKRYSRPCLAQQHLRSHLGERNYICSFPGCGKSFLRNSHLKVHLLIHKEEKPHVCALCGKGFNTGQQISRHLAAHRNNATKGNATKIKVEATEWMEETQKKGLDLGTVALDTFFDWTQFVYQDFSTTIPTDLDSQTTSTTNLSSTSLSSCSSTSSSSNEFLAGGFPVDFNPAAACSSDNTTPAINAGGAQFNEVGPTGIKVELPDSADSLFFTSFDIDVFQNDHVWLPTDKTRLGSRSLEKNTTQCENCHYYATNNLYVPFEELASLFPNNDFVPTSTIFRLDARYLFNVV